MHDFKEIIPALKAKLSIRRKEWEPMTQMYVVGDHMVCQRGYAEPYKYDLSWYEIDASDWEIADTGFPRLQV